MLLRRCLYAAAYAAADAATPLLLILFLCCRLPRYAFDAIAAIAAAYA